MAVRLNITMDEDIYARLKQEVSPKKISAFISSAVRAKLHPDTRTLNAVYRAPGKSAGGTNWRTTGRTRKAKEGPSEEAATSMGHLLGVVGSYDRIRNQEN
jgi:hypothetical protein